MKIVVISNGAESLLNFRGPLMAEMVRRGHEVLACAPNFEVKTEQALQELGVQTLHFSMARAGTGLVREFGSILELRRLMRRHQPDICFAYFIKPVIYGTIAAWLAGVKCRYGLIEGLGFAFTDGTGSGLKRKFLKAVITLLLRASAKKANRLMFLNPDDLEECIARDIVDRKTALLTGPTGVDLETWPQCPLPDTPITFILVARLLRDKGIAEYVEAARTLRGTHPETRHILLGGIDDNPAGFTCAEVEEWVAEGLIEWPGHVPVRPWLAQSHVFVLPSYREGVPRSTQEAMAMGRPVVTTDVPGCRETVEEGVNGYFVPARDPVALAAAMQRFLENPGLIASMGRESRRMAVERFDVHEQNRILLAAMGL